MFYLSDIHDELYNSCGVLPNVIGTTYVYPRTKGDGVVNVTYALSDTHVMVTLEREVPFPTRLETRFPRVDACLIDPICSFIQCLIDQ